jgi:hypothetical protein
MKINFFMLPLVHLHTFQIAPCWAFSLKENPLRYVSSWEPSWCISHTPSDYSEQACKLHSYLVTMVQKLSPNRPGKQYFPAF